MVRAPQCRQQYTNLLGPPAGLGLRTRLEHGRTQDSELVVVVGRLSTIVRFLIFTSWTT